MVWDKIKELLGNNKSQVIKRFSGNENKKVKKRLQNNLNYIKNVLVQSDDLISRKFYIGGDSNTEAEIVYFSSMVEAEYLQREILKPLMLEINLNEQNFCIK